jgi:hypothetical protein
MAISREQAVQRLLSLLVGELPFDVQDTKGFIPLIKKPGTEEYYKDPRKARYQEIKDLAKVNTKADIMMGRGTEGNPVGGLTRENLSRAWKQLETKGLDPADVAGHMGVKNLSEIGTQTARQQGSSSELRARWQESLENLISREMEGRTRKDTLKRGWRELLRKGQNPRALVKSQGVDRLHTVGDIAETLDLDKKLIETFASHPQKTAGPVRTGITTDIKDPQELIMRMLEGKANRKKYPSTGVGKEFTGPEFVKDVANYVDAPSKRGVHGFVPDINAKEAYGNLSDLMDDMFAMPPDFELTDPKKAAQIQRDIGAMHGALQRLGIEPGEGSKGRALMEMARRNSETIGIPHYTNKARFPEFDAAKLAELKKSGASVGGTYLEKMLRPIMSIDGIKNSELQMFIRQTDPALLNILERMPTAELRSRFLYDWSKKNRFNPEHPLAILIGESFPKDVDPGDMEALFVRGEAPKAVKRRKQIRVDDLSDFNRETLQGLEAAGHVENRPSEKSTLLQRIRDGLVSGKFSKEEGQALKSSHSRYQQANRAVKSHTRLGNRNTPERAKSLAEALLKLTGASGGSEKSKKNMQAYGKMLEAVMKNRTPEGQSKLSDALQAIRVKAYQELGPVTRRSAEKAGQLKSGWKKGPAEPITRLHERPPETPGYLEPVTTRFPQSKIAQTEETLAQGIRKGIPTAEHLAARMKKALELKKIRKMFGKGRKGLPLAILGLILGAGVGMMGDREEVA